jgi:thiol-disulfide isomerase/thioredoxin
LTFLGPQEPPALQAAADAGCDRPAGLRPCKNWILLLLYRIGRARLPLLLILLGRRGVLMNEHRRFLLAGLVLAAFAIPALAIDLGDPAPPLKISEWIKGQPVDLAAGKGKNVYVIEFWATWCKPCKDSIPHLTAMQKKYKDKGLIVIGITEERNPKGVAPFVEKMGDNMDYTVAYDENHQTNLAYMKAFGLNGIPHAFVIDKECRIAWSGHPNFGLEEAVDQIINGKYDVVAARSSFLDEKAFAKNREETIPLLTRYYALATSGQNQAELQKLGRQIVEKMSKDPQVLCMFAIDILDKREFQLRDFELALDAAKRAYELAGNRADVIATYARALWQNGKKTDAVDYQKKAIALVQGNPQMRTELEKALASYEQQLKAQP